MRACHSMAARRCRGRCRSRHDAVSFPHPAVVLRASCPRTLVAHPLHPLPACLPAWLQGLMATFRLVRRQDLLAYSVMALRGQKDVLELEVGACLRGRCAS